jgi:hypothetical protein
MNRFLKKLNNKKGSTLILVIIAVSFVGILATLILSLTTLNIQMKAIDTLSKRNFYTAEKALDEIQCGLEEITANEMEKAYKRLLLNYTIVASQTDKDKFLAEEFVKGMEIKLGGVGATKYDYEILKNFLDDPTMLVNDGSSGSDLLEVIRLITPKGEIDYRVILKGVKVKAVDIQGYATTIKTDINIKAPSMSVDGTSVGMFPSYSNYVFIADQKVQLSAHSSLIADGSIYAGAIGEADILNKYSDIGGIEVIGLSDLTVTGNNKMVTRSDIVVTNGSTLKIGETGLDAFVWAKNIRTRKINSVLNSTNPAVIDIIGETYTGDDLVLDTQNSEVTLKGKYHGFDFVDAAAPKAAENSAIMINGKDSKLDLTGLTDLIIYGKTLISARQATADALATDIVTGESLTVKHNQIAYLVPDKYMHCGHNPMTDSEVKNYEAGSLYQDKPIVDFKSDNDILKYLKEGDPDTKDTKYTKLVSKTAYDTKVHYFYLNFKNQESANKYFRDYYAKPENKAQIDKYMKEYALGSEGILLPSSFNKFKIAGNILSFKDGKSSIINSNIGTDTLDPIYTKEETDVKNKYQALTETLQDYASYIPANKDSVFLSLLAAGDKNPDVTLIEEKATALDTDFVTDGASKIKEIPVDSLIGIADCSVYLVYNPTSPYIIDTSTKGLVVATGDVEVSNEFEGTIISGSTIIVNKTGIEVSSNNKMISDIFNANKKEINDYFKTYKSSMAVSGNSLKQMDFSKQFIYENWTKNEGE